MDAFDTDFVWLFIYLHRKNYTDFKTTDKNKRINSSSQIHKDVIHIFFIFKLIFTEFYYQDQDCGYAINNRI